MKDGKCPKCNSATVYSRLNGMNLGESGVHVYISSEWASKALRGSRHYICTTCGYFEVYIEGKTKLEQWRRIGRKWIEQDLRSRGSWSLLHTRQTTELE